MDPSNLLFWGGGSKMNILFYSLKDNALDVTFWCMNMFFVTTVSYTCILAMVFITGDRLMHVFLTGTHRISPGVTRAHINTLYFTHT